MPPLANLRHGAARAAGRAYPNGRPYPPRSDPAPPKIYLRYAGVRSGPSPTAPESLTASCEAGRQ